MKLPAELAGLWKHGDAHVRQLLERFVDAWRPGTSPAIWFVAPSGGSAWPRELIADDARLARARRGPHELVPLADCARTACAVCGSDAFLLEEEHVDPTAFDADRYLMRPLTLCPFCFRVTPKLVAT